MLLQMSLIMLAEKRETSPPIFVFRMTYYISVHHVSNQARVFSMYPRRRLCLDSRAKIYTLQGRHERFVGESTFHTYFGGAPLLVGETAEVVLPSATSTEFDSIKLHTIYRYAGGVQQSVLVEYCTFVYNISTV